MYPFDYNTIFSYNYFWHKYYLTQRSFFALAKRPQYVNYEVLTNALSTRVIDFSQAEIYQLRNTEMSQQELEDLLISQNEFSHEKFMVRYLQMQALDKVETQILRR